MKASIISRRQRWMLPRTAFVLIVIGIAYIKYPDLSYKSSSNHNSPHHSGDLIQFSSRHLLQENLDDSNADSSPQSPTVTDEAPETCEASESVKKCECLKKLDASTNPNKTKEQDPLFPKDVFSLEQQQHGAVILHIIGILYMFYALALVCDEFFVPSLDVITEKLGISPDVAGATFMAAGGSAPELFTSVIGVFIAKSDVGIGTIVGSAVFNILFVIAACAFAAKEALSLSAWPLIRDVFFYSVSLIVLVIFFNDNQIYWYEALILFLWYFAYVGFMKFNEPAEDGLRKLLKLDPVDRNNLDRGVTLRKAAYRKGLFHLMNETINPVKKNKNSVGDGQEMVPLTGPPGGIVVHNATGLAGLKTTLQNPETGEYIVEDATHDNGKEMGPLADDEIPKVNNSEATLKDPDNAGDNDTTTDNAEKKTSEGDDDEEEEPIDMKFPTGENANWKKILIYLVSFPLMAPMYITLPDTRDKSKKKFFIITFLGSILWIAAFSYLMVWWATVAGEAIGIPPPVMGLTFLAAGTSVPDLITSVLVAQQGKGDMAVSSSVGSNIFDVTVGLPFPWLLYTLVNGVPVDVDSSGVGCSISMLFAMLLLVFLSILSFKWKMTKGMGIIMGFFYFIFVIVSLGFSYCWYICPIGK